MSTMPMEEILHALKQPFHPTDVAWKPGSVRRDGSAALALAYADLRAYQNRLDEVCGMDWGVTYTPWGERIICHLTIGGITRSSTGEPDTQAERSEIAGTAAEAQAFKRACSMFALGRYLYQLPTAWVEYDAQAKQFTAQAKAKLKQIVVQHYHRTLAPQVEGAQVDQEGDAQPDEVPADDEDDLAALRQQFDRLGTELYGDEWLHVCGHNVERITAGQTNSASDLTAEQLQKLIKGMQQVKRKRRSTRSKQAAQPAAA